MAGAATAVRRVDSAPDLDPEEFLDHDPRPGEVIFDAGDGTKEGRFDFTYSGDDPSQIVTIYDIEGRGFTMPKEWALLRLQKRWPANHPNYANMKVFYVKQRGQFR